jgi:hypothetical protein
MSDPMLDRERLARVLGLLGSSHDGEVLVAARQAERLRAEAGLTWPEILHPRLPAPQRQHQHVETVADAIDYALEFQDKLTAWEINFLRTLRRQRTPISTKQRAILFDQILDRVMARAA